MGDKCRCLVLPINYQEKICIQLEERYCEKLQKLFPQAIISIESPDIFIDIKNDKYYFRTKIEEAVCELKQFSEIMFIIESYIQYNCRGLVIHGGGVTKNNNAIIFIQARKSGKSTLIRDLIATSSYKYISDDLLIIYNNMVSGIGLPIRVREKLEGTVRSNGMYVDSLIDEIGEMRNIYVPNCVYSTDNVKLSNIVIPCYNKCGKNSINVLKGTEKILKILNNIKEYRSISFLFEEIIKISKDIPVIEIIYSDISFAREIIEEL